jgi:hypothetical protein
LLATSAQETYDFVAELYEANQFSFDKLVPWLREHVALDITQSNPQAWGFGAVLLSPPKPTSLSCDGSACPCPHCRDTQVS